MRERPLPAPGAGEILIEVAACGVCRTDLHVVDGELPTSESADRAGPRDRWPRRGAWRGRRGFCDRRARRRAVARRHLRHLPLLPRGRENLCDAPVFTGYTRDGGYATHAVADARFCFPLAGAMRRSPRSRRCSAPA